MKRDNKREGELNIFQKQLQKKQRTNEERQ